MSIALLAGAQEYKIAHNGGKLVLDDVDHAKIVGYNGTEVIITAEIEKNSEEFERAAGLKAINSAGLDDNTGLGLSVVKEGDNIKVTQIGQCMCKNDEGYIIKIPRSMGIDFAHSTYDSHQLTLENISKEIVVSTNYTNVELRDVTGPMSIKTVYGSIEAVFSEVSQENSVSLHSVYGLVDAALPASSKANLNLRTPYGQIFTDFDIQVEQKEGMRELSDKRVSGTINNGGVDFIMKSGYENIYLRKK